jgi:hypothetical protein
MNIFADLSELSEPNVGYQQHPTELEVSRNRAEVSQIT